MSEYIVKLPMSGAADEFVAKHGVDDCRLYGYKLTGEIVRCRDCKHYDRMNDDEGMCMVPDDDGDYARWMVDVVGYCYLGERRDA